MANSLVTAYRQALSAQGQTDDRDDYFIMRDTLVPLAQQNPDLLQKYPDFAQEYGQIRDANAPSLAGEFGRALKGGSEGTAATYVGAAALATGSDALKKDAQGLEADAAGNAPTIPTMEDIAPGQTGIARVFSKDTARYVAAKAGGMIPSLADFAAVPLAAAAAGSAVEPGLGTVAGAAEGVTEEMLGRGIIKSAIKSLLDEGVADEMVAKSQIPEASEDAIKQAILDGNQVVADKVSEQARALAAGRASNVANLTNVAVSGAGGLENETDNPELSLAGGVVDAGLMALPEVSLPARVIKSLFPKLTGQAAKDAAASLVDDSTQKLLAKVGAPLARAGGAAAAGTAGVVGMEATSIVVGNLAAGRDPLHLDDKDWSRIREAAIGGAIGSAPFAALAAGSPEQAANVPAAAPDEVGPPPAPPGAPAAPADAAAPVLAGPRKSRDIFRAIQAMSREQQTARLTELAQVPARTPDQDTEYQQLKALAPRAQAARNAVSLAPAADEAPEIPGEPPGAPPAVQPQPPEAVPPAPAAPAGPPELPGEPPGAPPAVQAEPPPSPTGDTPTYSDVGFDTQEAFAQAYAAQHEADAFETEDEFARRLYCQGQAA
jgi:hypothetical protein